MDKKYLKPTDAELDILRILWSKGPCTVREVFEYLPGDPPRGYTTVLKLLQIMAEKGLVKRDEHQRAHVYEASSSLDQMQKNLLKDLLDKVFDGSAGKLVMQALSSQGASEEELNEIRHLLKKVKGK